jgi:hypothetical protein
MIELFFLPPRQSSRVVTIEAAKAGKRGSAWGGIKRIAGACMT